MRSRATKSFAIGEPYPRETPVIARVSVCVCIRLIDTEARSLALIGTTCRECHSARSRRVTFAHAAPCMSTCTYLLTCKPRDDTHRLRSATEKVDIDAWIFLPFSRNRSGCAHTHTHTHTLSRAIYAAKSIRHEWNHDFHAWRKSRRLEWRDKVRCNAGRGGATRENE